MILMPHYLNIFYSGGNMKPDLLYNNYSEAGFTFSKDLITNYCISLYTKPFVILSGISGTGKTKIAQLFKPVTVESKIIKEIPIQNNNYVVINLTEGIMNSDGRGNFKSSDLQVLLSEDEFDDYEKERAELLASGGADNFKKIYEITMELDGKEYPLEFYVQRAISPLIRARFKSKRNSENSYNLQPILKKNFSVGDLIRLNKIDEKKFRVVKDTDTSIVNAIEEVRPKTFEDNICLIPVKSDWTDPSGIMGYYNIIENKYHIGAFLKHLLYALENPEIPFFVILDEMNLSKIEYYLSDVLSVLETRIPDKKSNDGFSSEKILLHSSNSADNYIDTDDEYFDIIPSKVEIPKNFYITGTINVDETTYMPSPKVLDRANIIEFNEVDLSSFFDLSEAKEKEIEEFVLSNVPDFSKPMYNSSECIKNIPLEAKELIVQINEILKKYNLHFGYRVANEIAMYIHNTLLFTVDNDKRLFKALDFQLVQKVMPKISGTQVRIEKPLVELFALLTKASIDIDNIDIGIIEMFNPKNSNFPQTVKKIQTMYARLLSYGFTSSIE